MSRQDDTSGMLLTMVIRYGPAIRISIGKEPGNPPHNPWLADVLLVVVSAYAIPDWTVLWLVQRFVVIT